MRDLETFLHDIWIRKTTRYFQYGILPKEEFDAYIFTGDYSNISDGLLTIHKKEIEFIASIKGRKIFASCFFHQLLGEISGGKVGKREERFLGWHKMAIKKEHEIFEGLNEPYFLNLNVDEIIKKPKNATILATSQDCKYQALSYGERMVGCQSHPEIFKKDAQELIETHREGLMDSCPDLEKIMEQTKKFADDKSSELFLLNMGRWLLS